ncbi:hypothetical protein ACFVW1_10465 [Streptomyces olivochromogenes]|uniref:hypothetical protein n=1 Tax=Streptomyces olivochromogenes TaxID=1963 RepID=UPI0036DAB90C
MNAVTTLSRRFGPAAAVLALTAAALGASVAGSAATTTRATDAPVTATVEIHLSLPSDNNGWD